MRLYRRLIKLLLVIIIVVLNQFITYAADVEPGFVNGSSCLDDQYYEKFTIEDPQNSSYSKDQITINLELNDENNKIEKWSSNVEVYMVYVKGDFDGYLYDYMNKALFSDLSLYPPMGEGGNLPSITQVSFYYKANEVLNDGYSASNVMSENSENSESNESNESNVSNESNGSGDNNLEEIQNSNKGKDLPRTGENTNIYLYFLGGILFFTGLYFVISNKKLIKA